MAKIKKNINLLPKSKLDKSSLGKFLKWTLTIGRYIVITTELIVVIAFLIRFKLDKNKASLQEEIKEKQTIVASFSELENKVRFLQKRLKFIKEIGAENTEPSLIIEELSKIMPLDLVLTELKITEKSFSLKGYCLSNVGLSTFLNGLRSNKQFSQINLASVSSKGKNDPTLKFTISAKIKGSQ